MNSLPLGEVACADAVTFLQSLPDSCLDACITDPPYAEVNRPYGRLTEAEWWSLIVEGVVPEVRRCLKPTGSAVFIIQPNSRKVGSMRGWVFEFMAWVCREWNMVQDAWWWNYVALPAAGATSAGLLRPSVKPCVWCGPEDCYRDQDSVLAILSGRTVERASIGYYQTNPRSAPPSGSGVSDGKAYGRAMERGGSTPFNCLAIHNGMGKGDESAGAHGHGAGTPLPLMRWWTRYIVPPGGVVCDPFMGSGTGALAAIAEGRQFIGCERDALYVQTARYRIAKALREHQDRLPLDEQDAAAIVGQWPGDETDEEIAEALSVLEGDAAGSDP